MSESQLWLMLVNSVSGENKTARMRIWRALKASGAAALRDGVYLLPKSESARAVFAELFGRLDAFKTEIAKLDEVEARRQAAALRRDIAALGAIDFFPGASRHQVESALADAEAALNARFSPDEPHAAKGIIPKREKVQYRGRTWATRARPWIDRVASAWLIRRFIDPKA